MAEAPRASNRRRSWRYPSVQLGVKSDVSFLWRVHGRPQTRFDALWASPIIYDTYLIVPAVNSSYCCDELSNIQNWATANNPKLNCQKSKEIIFRARGVRGKSVQLPPPCQSIERIDKLTVLGVVINDRMTAVDHVGYLLSSCSSSLYMLRTLRNHGTPEASYYASVLICEHILLSKRVSGISHDAIEDNVSL